MNVPATIDPVVRAPASAASTAETTAIVLLGVGVVGSAFLRQLNAHGATSWQLVGVGDSRRQCPLSGRFGVDEVRARLHGTGGARDDAALLAALDSSGARERVIVDATASAQVAARHADWLRRGYHVVTANKAANGGSLNAWRDLRSAQADAGTTYGDAATVGAGLPVIRMLRQLRACGDRLCRLEGVFSGSLGWLFSHYDGSEAFSRLLMQARDRGYCEPDPRLDLSGVDVARKLLILARNAGFELREDAITVENLVPHALRDVSTEQFFHRLNELDRKLAARCAHVRAQGKQLRYLARLEQDGSAHVALSGVSGAHAAAPLRGTANQFVINSTRYADQPLVIQGPGAGAEVTAQALLGDVHALAAT